MSENINFLTKLGRRLTETESEQFNEYFEDDTDASEGDIGGLDQPMPEVDIEVNIRPSYLDDEVEPEYQVHSDDSDFDGEGDNEDAIDDPRLVDLLESIIDGVSNEVEVEVEEQLATVPIEANRGEKYVGQGKTDKKVWWSMPSRSEKFRTDIARENRELALPTSKENFDDKRSAFVRVMPSSIIETIVIETNRKAKRVYTQNQKTHKHKKMRNWFDTNADEIYAFLGVLLYAGAEKSNLVHAKDLFDEEKYALSRAVMSLQRFEQLCRFIRFNNSATRPDRLKSDKLAPIRHVWTLFIMNIPRPFAVSKDFTIDEQLLPTRNRCSFRQYIPSKPGKYGIKTFWLVESRTNYPMAAEVYLGAHCTA